MTCSGGRFQILPFVMWSEKSKVKGSVEQNWCWAKSFVLLVISAWAAVAQR